MMIEVVNVHKSYRSGTRWVEALRGVSCRIERGRFAFIVGPSGSGKSTLLYLLGAIDRPTSGEIVVDGQDLVTMSEAAQNIYRREQVGFIFQSFNLISNLTALENVLVPFLPAGCRPSMRQRAIDLLTRGRPGRPARPPALPAFRRRAAASGDRPGPGEAADPGPRRRADRRARLEDRRRDLHHPPPAAGIVSGRRWWSSPTTAGSSRPTIWSWRSRMDGLSVATADVSPQGPRFAERRWYAQLDGLAARDSRVRAAG